MFLVCRNATENHVRIARSDYIYLLCLCMIFVCILVILLNMSGNFNLLTSYFITLNCFLICHFTFNTNFDYIYNELEFSKPATYLAPSEIFTPIRPTFNKTFPHRLNTLICLFQQIDRCSKNYIQYK